MSRQSPGAGKRDPPRDHPARLRIAEVVESPYVVAERYQLLEYIGEGGMGVVWRGFDLELDVEVAIKFLRDDLAGNDRRRACFRREVKLARLVTDPNVARVFEFGRDRGMYFLTMEFVAGPSLQRVLLRDGPVSPRQLHAHADGLCRGIAAAHAAGVVHGDIKPGNILLAPERGAVLTDFGIARALTEVLARDEQIGGTPLYMAPEQLLGGGLALQSDIYAAGVVLFEALTGELPWGECDEMGLLAAKCRPAPDLRAVAPGLPDAWALLIARCLRPDPAERPADGSALLARLREVGDPTDLGAPLVRGSDAPPASSQSPAPRETVGPARHRAPSDAPRCERGPATQLRGARRRRPAQLASPCVPGRPARDSPPVSAPTVSTPPSTVHDRIQGPRPIAGLPQRSRSSSLVRRLHR